MKYGWIKNPPDPRDYNITKFFPTLKVIPMVKYNLTPPVRDQGDLGSCVFHALLELMESEEIRRGDEYLENFSPLWAYHDYNTKVNGDPGVDNGAMPRLAMKLLQQDGVCLEKSWPYVPSKLAVTPPQSTYQEAAENQVLKYYDLRSETQRLSTLASNYNFACGITVFASFESDEAAATGTVPMPDVSKEELLGYHMIMVWGYDRHNKLYHCQNSWSEDWGNKGMFTLPFAFLDNARLADDFLVVQSME